MFKSFYFEVPDEDSEDTLIKLFKGTNCSIDDAKEQLENLYSGYRSQIIPSLKQYIEGGILDASKIGDDWFPNVKADIFLSHSHQDEGFIEGFAAWLYYCLGLTSFIDSKIWGFCDDLLMKIDEEYCVCAFPYEEFLSYSKVKQSTSHVHMLLNGALMQMIDYAECFIFVGTHNSLNFDPSTIKNGQYSTFSPWIYSEILASRLIKPKKPHRPTVLSESVTVQKESALKISYDLDIKHLKKIEIKHLQYLKSHNLRESEALDAMYGFQHT